MSEESEDTPTLQPEPITPEQKLAELQAKLDSYKSLEPMREALAADPSKIYDLQAALRGRQPDPIDQYRPQPAPAPQYRPIPDDPLDLLTPEKRKQLEENAIVDPINTYKVIASLTAQQAQMRFERQAEPLVQSSGQMLLDNFRSKMASQDPQYYMQILPIFDRMMAAFPDLRPLVAMNASVREQELGMRWGAAKAQVLDAVMKLPRKTEATLTSPESGFGVSPKKKSMFEEDPFMANMAKQYKFTPEQLKHLEGFDS